MSQEINLTLTGYRADEVLPETSGEYAVILEYSGGYWELWTLYYSAKHRAWNVYDTMKDEHVTEVKIDRVTHWFRLPEATAQKEEIHEAH